MQLREKVGKPQFTAMICGSRGSKSRLAEAAGAEPSGQMRDEKLHAVVARSTFRSENVQNACSCVVVVVVLWSVAYCSAVKCSGR